MKKYLTIIILTMVSCKKISPPESREIVDREFWLDAVAVTKQAVLSVSGNSTTFELEVAGMKNGKITGIYPDQMFLPDTLTGSIIFTPLSVQRTVINDQKSFQTVILLDASSDDWTLVDDGSLIDAVNRLKKVIGKSIPDQYFGVGFFARDEYSGEGPVKFFRNSSGSLFNHTNEEMMQFLSENYLHMKDATESSIYDAINKAADELIANNLSANRSITVMVGNADDGQSNISVPALILKCQQNNIAINLIMQNISNFDLYKMAHETGGFISENAGTSYNNTFPYNTSRTVLYHTYELLAGIGERYVVTCKATRPSPWYTNNLVRGYITANYYEEVEGEFLVDDLDVNQRLPVYFKIP